MRRCWIEFRSDENRSLGLRQARYSGGVKHTLDAGELLHRRAGKQVIQRKHRVGFPAAEVGLKLDDRIAARAGQALDRAGEQLLQAVRDESALEEIARILVFVRSFSPIDLSEIGGELRLLKAPGSNIGMRRDYLAPRLEPALRLTFGRSNRELARFRARLLVEADAQQLLLAALYLGSLFGRNGAEQAVDAVEGAIGVISREWLLMRPIITRVAQLLDQVALGLAKLLRENRVPLPGHHREQRVRVPIDRALGVARKASVAERVPGFVQPLVAMHRAHLALEIRSQADLQQIERLANAFVVRYCHRFRASARFL